MAVKILGVGIWKLQLTPFSLMVIACQVLILVNKSSGHALNAK